MQKTWDLGSIPGLGRSPSMHSLMTEKVKVTQSCPTLNDPMDCPARLLCPPDSPSKNPVVGWCSFLQGIFLTQGSNPGLLHCKRILYHLSIAFNLNFIVYFYICIQFLLSPASSWILCYYLHYFILNYSLSMKPPLSNMFCPLFKYVTISSNPKFELKRKKNHPCCCCSSLYSFLSFLLWIIFVVFPTLWRETLYKEVFPAVPPAGSWAASRNIPSQPPEAEPEVESIWAYIMGEKSVYFAGLCLY